MVAGILTQKNHRITWNHSRHSYLVDVGSSIEIPLMVVNYLYKNHLANPPFPKTRFFEIEIDEMRNNGRKKYEFKTIVPVLATKKPDWYLLKLKIKRGSWSVTERIHSITPDYETQWLYTDDFDITFLSYGDRHDGEMLITLITGKLDAIAQSIRSGTRIPSVFEDQQVCRDAFRTPDVRRADGASGNAPAYANHSPLPSKKTCKTVPSCVDTGILHNKAAFFLPEVHKIRLNLDQIEELRDLSWLTD